MSRQFETFCRRCGRKILMTRNERDGRWVPCDPEIRKYKPSGGSCTYVNTDGILCYGKLDVNGEWGYRKHRRDCA